MIRAAAISLSSHIPAWSAGVSLLFLGIGVQGGLRPLQPSSRPPAAARAIEEIMLEDFDPGAAPEPAANDADPPPAPEIKEDFVIPSIEEIIEPYIPPPMPELLKVEPPLPLKPKPPLTPPPPKPKKAVASSPSPSSTNRLVPPTRSAPAAVKTTDGPTSASGTGGSSSIKSGSGRGNFPSPSYPSAARLAKLQGTVRLSVVVDSRGIPTSVTVVTSSGHRVLDSAAVSQVQRRWRWPSGPTRRVNVPITFRLK